MKKYLVGLALAPFVLIGCSVPTDSGSESGATKSSTPATRNEPHPVALGKAFKLGKHQMNTGWKVVYQEYLGTKVAGSVTNVSNKTSTAFFHIKFLNGKSVVANMQCASDDLEPGQSQAIECLNTVPGQGKLPKYTTVTAEADF